MFEHHPLIHRWNVSPGQRPTVEALPAGFSKSLCQGYYSQPLFRTTQRGTLQHHSAAFSFES